MTIKHLIPPILVAQATIKGTIICTICKYAEYTPFFLQCMLMYETERLKQSIALQFVQV